MSPHCGIAYIQDETFMKFVIFDEINPTLEVNSYWVFSLFSLLTLCLFDFEIPVSYMGNHDLSPWGSMKLKIRMGYSSN